MQAQEKQQIRTKCKLVKATCKMSQDDWNASGYCLLVSLCTAINLSVPGEFYA